MRNYIFLIALAFMASVFVFAVSPEEAIDNIANANKKMISFSAGETYKRSAIEEIDKGLEKRSELANTLEQGCSKEEIELINSAAICGINAENQEQWLKCGENVNPKKVLTLCSNAMGKIVKAIGVMPEAL